MSACMYVCLIITVKPLDRSVPNFGHISTLAQRWLMDFFWGGRLLNFHLIFQKTWADPKMRIYCRIFAFGRSLTFAGYHWPPGISFNKKVNNVLKNVTKILLKLMFWTKTGWAYSYRGDYWERSKPRNLRA